MDRARVVCNMFVSMDGRIQNSEKFYRHEDAAFAGEIYERLNYSYGQAIGIGRNTIDDGRRPDLSPYAGRRVELRDRVRTDTCTYGVVFDRFGKLAWSGKYQEYSDMPKRRTIEVLTRQVRPEYLAYLDEREIPYLFGGERELDLALVLQKLKQNYEVETMVLGGGATLNGAFLEADLVDEISLVIAPGVNGSMTGPGFAGAENGASFPRFFRLKAVEEIGHHSLILRYER